MSRHPLERAARALCSLDGHPENATMDGKPLWQNYLPEVRAVLEAISEPSEDVLVAMREPFGTHVDGFPIEHNNRDSWRAAIEAIWAAAPQ